MDNIHQHTLQTLEDRLREEKGYDRVHSITLEYGAFGEPQLAYCAADEHGEGKWQGFEYLRLDEYPNLETACEAQLARVPSRKDRELASLAGAMAKMKELADSCSSVEAQAYGKVFAEKLNELRLALPKE